MDKLHWVSLGFGSLGVIWSVMVGHLGLAVSVLILMMALDYSTGLISGWINKELNSAKGTRGFAKKLLILILIGGVYLLEKVVFDTQHIGDGAAFAYIFIEFISITENVGKAGVPLGPVENIIAVLKEKGNGKGADK
ncbi:holin family protein [Fredinandcohnia humi]